VPVYGNTGRTPKAAIHSPNLAERLAPFAIDRTARPGIHALERASRPFSQDRAKGVKPGIASHNGENPPSCEAGSHPLEATPAVSGTSSRYLAANRPTIRAGFLIATSQQPTHPRSFISARLQSCPGVARRSTHEQGYPL